MDSYLGKGVVLIDHRTGAVHGRDAIVAAAAARAGELRGCGVARLDRVVIGHGSDSAVLVDLLAIWSLGAAAVMVPATGLFVMLSESERRLFVRYRGRRSNARWQDERGPRGPVSTQRL